MRKEDILFNYFYENVNDKSTVEGKKFGIDTSNIKSGVKGFEKIFGLENAPIDERKFDSAINGEGKEKDKIKSLHSSALQSLLIFYSVSKENPIIISDTKYTESYFEYKNKVIGYASSIDVALVSEDGESVIFIESKLTEPIYDAENNEIGVTYFSNNENGYKNKLQLEYKDLISMGIICPCLENEYGKASAQDISGKGMVTPIDNNPFVYAYGIKQTLSHLIGILNYKNPNKGCSSYLKSRDFKNVYFMTIYNKLPNFDMFDAHLKLKNFANHLEKVKDVVMKKDNVKSGITDIFITTYQDLYKENAVFFGKDYIQSIVKYYRLSEV